MGLDTTHDCWHGAYSRFMQWRIELAKAAGMPPLRDMRGFSGDRPCLEWEDQVPDVIHVLLNHSDCDGEIAHSDCLPLARRLCVLAALVPEEWMQRTIEFAAGLLRAHNLNQNVEFH